VYLRKSQNEEVPAEVFQALPSSAEDKLQQVYLQGFIDAIIGMRIDQEKSFMIPAVEAYGDEDLYYNVTLKAIVYDAVIPTSVPTTSSKSSSSLPTITPFPGYFFMIFLFMTPVVLGQCFRKRS
jgi:hypothetical protein